MILAYHEDIDQKGNFEAYDPGVHGRLVIKHCGATAPMSLDDVVVAVNQQIRHQQLLKQRGI